MRGTAGNGSQHLLTRQGGHVTSHGKSNKMRNTTGDPSSCTHLIKNCLCSWFIIHFELLIPLVGLMWGDLLILMIYHCSGCFSNWKLVGLGSEWSNWNWPFWLESGWTNWTNSLLFGWYCVPKFLIRIWLESKQFRLILLRKMGHRQDLPNGHIGDVGLVLLHPLSSGRYSLHMSHLSLEYENMPIAVSFHIQIDP